MNKIKCAAIKRSDGVIVIGKNHAECVQKSPEGTCKNAISTYGFVTEDDKFITRQEAAKIAFEAGQISQPVDMLFSEHLTNEWGYK